MAAPGDSPGAEPGRSSIPLAEEWRALRRAATIVALLTAPAFFLLLWERNGWDPIWALLVTIVAARTMIARIDATNLPSPANNERCVSRAI